MQRLFAKGFKGDKHLLSGVADDGRAIAVAHDPGSRCHYLWLPRPSGEPGARVNLDLRKLPIPPHTARVIVEEVSPTHSGGIVATLAVPATKRLSLDQPADSVWLMTVAGPGPVRTYESVADACVRRDTTQRPTHDPRTLAVSLDLTGAGPTEVSYLAFEVDPVAHLPRYAYLELFGASADDAPLTFMVYALTDTSWAGEALDWDSAPYLDGTAVHPTNVGEVVFPAGQASALGTPAAVRLDVTDVLRQVRGDTIGFLLIRERRHDDDGADDGRRAVLAGVGTTDPTRRPRLTVAF